MSDGTPRETIVIVGGGIIGCTTAYYLTRHPRFDSSIYSIILLEASRIANGASGKAGGLVASWAFPNNLARLSFDLHEQLAKEHNGDERWGYRRVKCGLLSAGGHQPEDNRKIDSSSNSTYSLGKLCRGSQKEASVLPEDLDWFDAETAKVYEELADMSSTAQVHPLHFTKSMAKLAQEGGAKIVMGMVEHIDCSDLDNASRNPEPLTACLDSTQKKVISVTYTDRATSEKHTISTSTVVLAAGPWTPTLWPKVEMSLLRAHSVTIKLKEAVSAYCLFTNITPCESPQQPSTSTNLLQKSRPSKSISLEIYARPNNEVYICSPGDFDVPLPAPTNPVEVSTQICQEMVDAAISVSDNLRNGQVTGRRACYLPMENVGVNSDPLIGQSDVRGLFVATRHACWGISNAPGTGKVISELIFEGKVSCINARNLGHFKKMAA